MQKIFVTLLLIFSMVFVFGQRESIDVDSRVLDHFGLEKVDFWQNTGGDSIRYYNFIVSHAFEVFTQEYIEQSKVSNIETIHLKKSETDAIQNNLNAFNILSSSIPWKSVENKWYKIDGINLYLFIHSESYLNNKFKARK